MISAASTAARLRTPAAGVGAAMMLPERPSGPLGRGKVAFAVPGAPGLRAKPHFGASASVVGASWPLSTLSTSSSPPSSRRSRSVTARAASSPAPFPTSSREPALGILAPGPDEDAWRPGDPITPFMENRKRWLMEDLPHLFDDIGIDKSGYADVVEFRDPITSVSCLSYILVYLEGEREGEEEKTEKFFNLLSFFPRKKKSSTTRSRATSSTSPRSAASFLPLSSCSMSSRRLLAT